MRMVKKRTSDLTKANRRDVISMRNRQIPHGRITTEHLDESRKNESFAAYRPQGKDRKDKND